MTKASETAKALDDTTLDGCTGGITVAPVALPAELGAGITVVPVALPAELGAGLVAPRRPRQS